MCRNIGQVIFAGIGPMTIANREELQAAWKRSSWQEIGVFIGILLTIMGGMYKLVIDPLSTSLQKIETRLGGIEFKLSEVTTGLAVSSQEMKDHERRMGLIEQHDHIPQPFKR